MRPFSTFQKWQNHILRPAKYYLDCKREHFCQFENACKHASLIKIFFDDYFKIAIIVISGYMVPKRFLRIEFRILDPFKYSLNPVCY